MVHQSRSPSLPRSMESTAGARLVNVDISVCPCLQGTHSFHWNTRNCQDTLKIRRAFSVEAFQLSAQQSMFCDYPRSWSAKYTCMDLCDPSSIRAHVDFLLSRNGLPSSRWSCLFSMAHENPLAMTKYAIANLSYAPDLLNSDALPKLAKFA